MIFILGIRYPELNNIFYSMSNTSKCCSKCCHFHQRIKKKVSFHKNIKQHFFSTLIIINRIEHQISILKLFLKDHVIM